MLWNHRSTILAGLAGIAILTTTPHAPAEDFLQNGGSITGTPDIGPVNGDEGFLRDGGSVRVQPRIGIGVDSGPQDFLEGGGSIREEPDIVLPDRPPRLLGGRGATTRPDIHSTSEDEEFLEDGGSFGRVENGQIRIERRGRAQGWHDLPTPRTRAVTRNSFTVFDVGDGGSSSFVTVPAATSRVAGTSIAGPSARIIDVEHERLDRRPIPASGIDIISRGGPKIIRIASGYDRNSDAAAEARAREPRLIPWSAAWSDWCQRNYASFDADRGTYGSDDGSLRFCTGQ
ncbi:BA14K family protein [Aurantimonas sp. VKM B-3413]|uniref:BA14K family protein n=1 Tax=Aurantimonas sp. VKM B-3413 TaxID=2779401 RepID=UPI001E2A6C8B|nr:BA14K family protein [Aurantimonas sp. VKM B-3413]MCB8836908.1 BA14K family protein [Aurantimonas sp. VKM B-3413]